MGCSIFSLPKTSERWKYASAGKGVEGIGVWRTLRSEDPGDLVSEA
jgi:hypothetical protein